MSDSKAHLKRSVLEDQMGFLCEELGDPGRYFPYLRSKRMLDSSDCQTIRSQATFREQVLKLVGILKCRESSKGEQAFDVLVDALKKQRVQAHIARTLQKALARASEEPTITNGTASARTDLPEEEVPSEPSLSCNPTSTAKEAEQQYKIHPVHGALPPLPTAPSSEALNSPTCDGDIHPQYGMLPPRSDDMMCARNEFCLKTGMLGNFSGSESELGGQSQPNSMLTDSSNADSSMSSSRPSSHDTSSFLMSRYDESIEVSKLEAKVKDLTFQLEEALSENKKKDMQIQKLQQLLGKAGLEGSMLHPLRPHNLKMNGSDNTLVTPSGTYSHYHGRTYHSQGNITPHYLQTEQEQPQRSPNSFVSRSKSSSPSASVSFV